MDGPSSMKVVILDEIDGVSDQFFKALRATMETFASNSRFIATCNYINKLPGLNFNLVRALTIFSALFKPNITLLYFEPSP